MIRIAICDDDIALTSKIEQMLEDTARNTPSDLEIEVFFDGQTLKNSVGLGEKFDIIYMDIEMKGLNGIDTAKYIRTKDHNVILIYVSSFETYLTQLFEVEPFRFIKKPINETIFKEYFLQAYKRVTDHNVYFTYKFKKVLHRLLLKKIMYFESHGRVINIVTEDGIESFYGKLNEIESKLEETPSGFLRIHQSFLVNYLFMKKVTYTDVVLMNGNTLHISEERQKIIRSKYSEIIGGEMFGV